MNNHDTEIPEIQEYPWKYIENAFPEDLAHRAFKRCVAQTIDLPQKKTMVFGNPGREPRLSQLYSRKDGHTYKYSGVLQTAKPFSDIPEMDELVLKIEEHMINMKMPIQNFDTALVNHYRANTRDHVGAHRDKDGVESVIASISLGREARFIIYKDKGLSTGSKRKPVEELILKPNSLLLMLPGMQDRYLHEIKPFTKKELKANPELGGARINITLRRQLVN